jgi:hypothetical protein
MLHEQRTGNYTQVSNVAPNFTTKNNYRMFFNHIGT